MRNTMGWLAAALVVAGCGGSVGTASQAEMDEHKGENAVCAECKVNGGGQIFLGTQRVQFAAEAIPESGPAAGPGFGGAGIAAKGHIQFQAVPANEGALVVDIRGAVDTILGCSREDGVLTATFSGIIEREGDGRFTAVVTDGGEPANDTIFMDPLLIGTTPVANSNIQVHGLAQCELKCPPGQCLCPGAPPVCEQCDDPPTDPPTTAPKLPL